MQIQFGQILFQIINFGILVFILQKFLYRPILKILEERAERIKAGLEAAEKSIIEKAKLEEIKKKMLVDTEKQANDILEQARTRAQKLGKEIVAEAREEADRIISKEHQILDVKMRQTQHQLQAQVAKLVIDTTQAVLQQSLTSKEQQLVINRQIDLIKKAKIN